MSNDLNDEIAQELKNEEEARIMAEYAPKSISRTQVKGAKFAWMAVAIGIDIATAYAYFVILAPFWWYGVLWLIAGAGGLMFAEWLWERIGNNEEQTKIASASKTVSAVAVLVMALLSGVALILGVTRAPWMEIIALVSAVGLACFHGWQSYQYHEKDDDYIAATEDARADANNQKEIRKVHRAGQRVAAKKVVHRTGAKYQEQHGNAFAAAAGRSYASETEKPKVVKQETPQDPNSPAGKVQP